MQRVRIGSSIGKPLGIAVGLILSASFAHSQWSVTFLHPAGTDSSSGYDVRTYRQVGSVTTGGVEHGGRWTGTAASWQDLNPAGSAMSAIYGTDGVEGVGFADFGSDHAGLWSGPTWSFIDLHPSWADDSEAFGVRGGEQVGFASLAGISHAAMWHGSAASIVDLHPAAWTYSRAVDTAGGTEVGHAGSGNVAHAGLWRGTAASWVDLHPGFAELSWANGADIAQQVGDTAFDGAHHASLWRDTAASWQNLHPAGWHDSVANDVFGPLQVGEAFPVAWNLNPHASLWNGTAASHVDLHTFLPGIYTSSLAQGVWIDPGGTVFVVGLARNGQLLRTEAVMWTLVPEPSSLLFLGGGLLALARFRNRVAHPPNKRMDT